MEFWVLIDGDNAIGAYTTHERARKAFIDHLRKVTDDDCTVANWTDECGKTYKDCIRVGFCLLDGLIFIQPVELEEE